MASFTVLFYGICTNFRHVPQHPHIDRMVLVNGSQENITILQGELGLTPPPEIEPHRAWLLVDGEKDAIQLQGVHITVHDPVPGLDFHFECVPNLTTMNVNIGKVLGPPSDEVVLDKNPSKASCYFDFTGGKFSGCSSKSEDGAALTKVVVQTNGAPRLHLKAFPGAPEPSRPVIDVPDGGTVWLMNVPNEATDDDDDDFYLHYLTAKKVPRQPAAALPVTCPPCGTPMPKLPKHLSSHIDKEAGLCLMAGAGCSNSNFP